MSKDAFASAAEEVALKKLDGLRHLSLKNALSLPQAEAEDIVVAGKEVQLTVFRQIGIPNLPEAVLITAQISRAGLGGIISYHHEKGLVFLPNVGVRDATDDELLATGG